MAITSKAIERTSLQNVTGKDGSTTSLGILQDARNRAGTTNELYNQVVQNRTLLNTQIQQANTTFENTLQTTQDNIYAAQRAAKAKQAALGYVGQIAAAQTQGDLQRQINSQLSDLLNQSETGAINIAGQQSQLNQAEIQALSSEIADAYVQDYGIKDNVNLVQQDKSKYAANIILGILGGALGGGVSGGLVSRGITSGSALKTTLGLAGILGGGGYAIGSALQNSPNIHTTDATGQNLGMIAGLSGLGTALGLGGLAKATTAGKKGTGWISDMLGGIGKWKTWDLTAKKAAAKTATTVAENAAAKTAGAAATQAAENAAANVVEDAVGATAKASAKDIAKTLASKAGGFLARGGWFGIVTSLLGAAIGGGLAGRTMPYVSDRVGISNDSIAKAFADMGYSMDDFYDAGDSYTKQMW